MRQGFKYYYFCWIVSLILNHKSSFGQDFFGWDLSESYEAGSTIQICVDHERDSVPNFFLSIIHSHGALLIKSDTGIRDLRFTLPKYISEKRGWLDVKLVENNQIRKSSQTEIVPNVASKRTIEAYLGPKHIITQGEDFSMVLGTVLDSLDNPYPFGTSIEIKTLINNQLIVTNHIQHHLVAYKRIFSPNRAGYGAVSMKYKEVGSKEFRLDFYPNKPSSYQINFDREHSYADGLQLIRFYTSRITDKYNEVMGDGTQVYFQIEDHLENITVITGQTVQGIAEFFLPAPIYATTWIVKSEIPNFSNSNNLRLSFRSAISDAPAIVDKNLIIIGPVLGYMGQYIKDGMLTTLTLYDTCEVFTFQRPTSYAKVEFDWQINHVPAGIYTLEIEIADFRKKHLKLGLHE